MDSSVIGIIAITAIAGLVTWAITYLAEKEAKNSDN